MYRNFGFVASGIMLCISTTAFAESPVNVDDMVKSLVPSDAPVEQNVARPVVLNVQNATKTEIIDRLDNAGKRSLGNPGQAPILPVLVAGHEVEILEAVKKLPSMQVVVAFQGTSDALAPESGALLGALGQALSDQKLAASRFLIGVHTNSVGSDDYNLSLSALRAKAIVDALAAVHGVARDRLVPLGFGRLTEANAPGQAVEERIRIVNLGASASPAIPAAPGNAPVAKIRPLATLVNPAPVVKLEPAARPALNKLGFIREKHRIVRRALTPPPPQIVLQRRPLWNRMPPPHIVRAAPDEGGFDPRIIRRHPGWWNAGRMPIDPARMRFHAGPRFRYPDEPYVQGPPVQRPYNKVMSSDFGEGNGGFGRGRGGNGAAGGGGGGAGAGGAGGGGAGAGGAGAGGAGGGGAGAGGAGAGGAGGGSAGGGAGGGGNGGGWSDRRLKRHIRLVGRSPRGFFLYSFQYIWGGPFYVGVMAQDLLVACPEAVRVGPEGYMRVDYDKLDIRMMTLDAWQAGVVAGDGANVGG